MQFAVGFIFNVALNKVLLIRKNRPAWQKGKLNGIGGKVEQGETSIECIEREVYEETGLEIKIWTEVGALQGKDWTVFVFTTIYSGDIADAVSKTDESLVWSSPNAIPKNVISNLHWLIPLCIDKLRNKEIKTFTALY